MTFFLFITDAPDLSSYVHYF